ncbi:hypothetical protein GY45DRAFT_1331907 [Cubamyces sp. BRFM 1775]|nr:hypothetical protein GY45DRAFT_1331907 [Cubamyces sp. BRFM 1775]
MHFSAVLVTAALAASATTTTLAVACYNATECFACESRSSISNAAQVFCGGDKWKDNEFLPWGNAQVTMEGSLDSQQTCLDGFADIVDQCYGFRDGGIFTYKAEGHDARLDVNFCKCE